MSKKQKPISNKIGSIHWVGLTETAELIVKINPYFKGREPVAFAKSMKETVIKTIKMSNSMCVMTAGYVATITIFDEKNKEFEVEFFSESVMVYEYLQTLNTVSAVNERADYDKFFKFETASTIDWQLEPATCDI